MVTSTVPFQLRDGRQAVLRPLQPDDRDRLVAAFNRLSGESRYRRFFAPVQTLSDRSVQYLVQIDHHDHEAIAAIDSRTDTLVGVARYVRPEANSDHAEAAVVVADDWQGQGLGRELLECLVRRAVDEDVSRFTALVQADNRHAVELLAELGPTTRSLEGDLVELEIELGERRLGPALHAALRAAAASAFGVRPVSERLAGRAKALWEHGKRGAEYS